MNFPALIFRCYKLLHTFVLRLIVIGLFSSGASAQPTKLVASKPNFIIIFADDLGYGDIGPFGSKVNRTPNLDRMAREGMKLTSFYAAPVCTPSRAQMLTGCYAKRVSLPAVLGPASSIGISDKEHTIAELLKQQGYATMCIGKWHVGDHPDFLPTHHGFDHYFGIPYSNDMGKEDGQLGKGNRPPLPLVRDDKVIEVIAPRDQDRITERYTDEAVKFIREQKNNPFFLYLPHTAVHTPIHPGDKFRGKSTTPFNDWVEELDWSVGRVLDTVRELGVAERTLVVFTSDNGPWFRKARTPAPPFPCAAARAALGKAASANQRSLGGREKYLRTACVMRWPQILIACQRLWSSRAARCLRITRLMGKIFRHSCSARPRPRHTRRTFISAETSYKPFALVRGNSSLPGSAMARRATKQMMKPILRLCCSISTPKSENEPTSPQNILTWSSDSTN